MLPGANSKEPISIEADKLVYFDKEQKAIYTGNVVAIQGDSKITCSAMTIFLAKTEPQTAGATAKTANANATPAAPVKPASAAAAPGTDAADGVGGSQVKHMDAVGPVTVVSKTQVATGDRGSYDKDQNKVWLFGNVTLSDGGNVTKGDKLTYDLTSGEAVVDGTRVKGQFIPGSSGASEAPDKSSAPKKEVGANANDKPNTPKKKIPADDAAAKP
jgi:lipopolysaccharide export system protein LptA